MPSKRGPDYWTGEIFLERFVPKIEFGEHWIWIAKARSGTNYEYPAMQWQGQKRAAHRLSYSFFHCNGKRLPRHLDVHHDCRIKLCVHPDHLDLITVKEHRQLERPTHCIHGHEYTKDNYAADGSCRTCKRIRSREFWRAKHWEGKYGY